MMRNSCQEQKFFLPGYYKMLNVDFHGLE